MTLPNIISIARILFVPLTVWLILADAYLLAFLVFVIAGASDGVDGFIARRYNLRTELGAYLDPLADKLLLVSIYITLGMLKLMPAWLVILVVSRDVLIVGAVILSWLLGRPVKVQPLMLSKINTVGQILLAGGVLAVLGLAIEAEAAIAAGSIAVAVLTVTSGALYMREWARHMVNGGAASP